MREEIRAAVEALRAHGDAAVHYVEGLEILGAADAERLPDRLHPDAAGYRLLGERFLTKVARRLFRAGQDRSFTTEHAESAENAGEQPSE
jgi:lysophospholipase L1-like esterase